MDLKKEMAEFCDSYKEGSILARTLLILGLFFSLSSLTSLSSAIIEWKGFILEGIRFYQIYFVEPVSFLAVKVGLSYSKLEIHVATVSSICIAAGSRVQALGQKVAFRKINERYDSNLKPDLSFYWVMAIVFPVGIWAWYGITEPVIRPWVVIIISIFLPVFMTAPKIIMSKFGWEYFEKNDFSYFKSYYIYIISLLILIGVLAAINLGINTENKPNNHINPTAQTVG